MTKAAAPPTQFQIGLVLLHTEEGPEQRWTGAVELRHECRYDDRFRSNALLLLYTTRIYYRLGEEN